jgi:hypothetical protein
MTKLKLNMNTHDMIVYHLLQRFIYQYHSLFAIHKNHPNLEELTQLWFIKIFSDNPYFNSLQNSILINYEIKEDKDLLIVLVSPLHYKSFLVSLNKNINSCVTYTDNEGTTSDIDIFSIEYELVY